jgi:hypothetical protein
MKGKVLLRLVLAAVIVVSMVEFIGTVSVPTADSAAAPAAHPCVSDSDCPGNMICCPINNICTTPRGCRKDPL